MGDPTEMLKYVQLNNPLFRSTDSCNSVWSAMNNFNWREENFTRIKTPHDYFDRELTNEQYDLAVSNIEYFSTIFKQ